LILIAGGFGKSPSLVHDIVPSALTVGTNVVPFLPIILTAFGIDSPPSSFHERLPLISI
jgi:hypothetical protein